MSFADNLAVLPDSDGKRLRLHDAQGLECGVIENAPGTAGSFKVYAYLAERHGGITPEAAIHGVALFAEHADDARQNPGKHPNIDRLFACIAKQSRLDVLVQRD